MGFRIPTPEQEAADLLRFKADSLKYHRVMRLLQNMGMPHGTCEPRSRKACTNCNSRDELLEMLAAYKGGVVSLQ